MSAAARIEQIETLAETLARQLEDEICQIAAREDNRERLRRFALDCLRKGIGQGLRLVDQSKAKWRDLRLGNRAALRCGDHEFQRWLGVANTDAAARVVRARCGVKSRREIVKGTAAGEAWELLDSEFNAWRKGLAA